MIISNKLTGGYVLFLVIGTPFVVWGLLHQMDLQSCSHNADHDCDKIKQCLDDYRNSNLPTLFAALVYFFNAIFMAAFLCVIFAHNRHIANRLENVDNARRNLLEEERKNI